jgi:hypothetical protein
MRTKVQPQKTATKSTKAKATPKKPAPKKAATKPDTTAKPAADSATEAKPKAAKTKKLSAIDAAAKVLVGAEAMTTKEMIDAMIEKQLWSSPGGKTPDRTLYSAILREIATKGNDARFKKTDRGKFALARK